MNKISRYPKITIDFVKEEFKKRDYKLIDTVYTNAHTPLRYICNKHPNIEQTINWNNFKSGEGCKFCGKERAKEKLSYGIEFAKEKFKEAGYELLETEYKNVDTLMRFRCPFHEDLETKMSLRSILHGHKCKFCAGNVKLTQEEAEKIANIYGFHLLEKYEKYNSILKMQCLKNSSHIITKSLGKLVFDKGGCRLCNKEKREKEKFEELKKDFATAGYKVLDTKYYDSDSHKVRYICPIHPNEELSLTWSNFKHGVRCPLCKNKSKGENKIREILLKLNIKFQTQKKFNDCKNINPLPFDFYLPDYNLCIEYQGKQHCKPIKFSSSQTEKEIKINFSKILKRDRIKEEYCLKNNINFLVIYFFEFNHIEKILKKELYKIKQNDKSNSR